MDGFGFRSEVAEGLIKCKKGVTRKRGRKSSSGVEKNIIAKKRKGRVAPNPNKGYPNGQCWTLPSDHRRCKFPGCKSKATIKCAKWHVNLCLNKESNGFLSLHTQ